MSFEKYKDGLLKEKVESMKQLDRIEFVVRCNNHKLTGNHWDIGLFGSLILSFVSFAIMSLSFIVLLQSAHMKMPATAKISLYLFVGFGTLSIFFLVFFIIVIIAMVEEEIKARRSEVKFIEEHTKK